MDPLPTLGKRTYRLPRQKIEPFNYSRLTLFSLAYTRAPIGPNLGLINIFNGGPVDDQALRFLENNLTQTSSTRKDSTSWLESRSWSSL
jgi:hypothetical protein